MDDTFDIFLKQRAVPLPRSNLAESIIAAAKPRRPAVRRAGFLDMLSDLFVIPQPAFAMVAVLVLGLTLGTYYKVAQPEFPETMQAAYASFLMAEGGTDYGDFL